MAQDNNRLGSIDLTLLVLSMAASALIGLYFTNKNKSIDSYMMGDKQLSVMPVAISLMTSCLSGLTLLGASAEFYYQGPSYAFAAIPMLICGPITAFTMLPVFYQLNELSLYRYLHKRYGFLVKYIVNTVFIVQMIFYNSVVLYVPSMALESILGVTRFYSILIIGLMCVAYSAIGGLKAVVWTDFFQAFMMYAAIVTVGVLGTYDAGGLKQVFDLSFDYKRLNLDGFFNFDVTTRHTFLGILFGSTVKHIYLVGVNQVQIQRALSLPSIWHGQMAFIFCSVFGALMILFASYLGAVIVAAYRSCDPYLAGQIPRRDAIIVHYVANRLAHIPGLRGVFVAGIFSATLSTLSSFANSMAALALEDYIKPILRQTSYRHSLNDRSSRATTYLAKTLAIFFGLICVMMAYVVNKANSRLLQATTTMFGAIGVPFLGSFALGIFTRFTNTLGILAGFLVTLTLGTYITIKQTFVHGPLMPVMPVYYNEKCQAVFNMTSPPSSLPSISSQFGPDYGIVISPTTETPFSLDQISYMMLPCVQFVLMIIVASVVSLLTGGWNQQVDDKYLVKSKRSKPKAADHYHFADANQVEHSQPGESLASNGGNRYASNIVLSMSDNAPKERPLVGVNKAFDAHES